MCLMITLFILIALVLAYELLISNLNHVFGFYDLF